MHASPLSQQSLGVWTIQGMHCRDPKIDVASHVRAAPDVLYHDSVQQQRLERALRRDKQRQKRIRESGIEYDYEPLEATVPPKAKHTRLD